MVREKVPGTLPIIDGDGAVGDPASKFAHQSASPYIHGKFTGIGVSVLIANWTRSNLSDTEFSNAAADQLEYLLDVAPRTPDGAISHRASQVQLWYVAFLKDN